MKTTLSLIVLSGLAFLTSSAAQAPFTRITGGPQDTPAFSLGCSLVDYDDDGDPDIFVAMYPNNCLYRNDGGFQFSAVTSGPIVTDQNDTVGGAWADFDNDGDLDMFVANWSSPAADVFYRNDGGGQFARVGNGPWVEDKVMGAGASWADFDNDGLVDIYVGTVDGYSRLWRNNGLGGVSSATGAVTSVSYGHTGSAWADFDNDGDQDLFVACTLHNAGQKDLFFENQGDGTFDRIMTGPQVSVTRRTAPAAWGDFDNDGDFDLFVGAGCAQAPVPASDLPDLLYRNNGDRTFTRILEGPVVNDTALSFGAAWGDYDNDGCLDLIVANQSDANLLYHNERDGTFSRVLEGELVTDLAHSQRCAWADFDNDGFLDLFVTACNGYANIPEPDLLYRNQGNSNKWLILRLVGTVSNRAAIGTKIRALSTVSGNPVWQLRQVSGGESWAQSDLRVHFGLGDATNVTTLRIEWPSGRMQELSNIAANQILTITEPARLVPLGSREFKICCWQGMSFEIQKSHDLQTWDSLGMVTNLTGTLVYQDTQSPPETACCFYRTVSR